MSIDALLSRRVRDLRKQRGYALDTLAGLSGVSRSMISLIERGQTSPTAAVLDKLAGALGVTLASLFSEDVASAPSPLSRRAEQRIWTDPASGYERRQVSPNGSASPLELAEVLFPPGETVTFENAVRTLTTHQLVWMLEGEMIVVADDTTWRLHAGDCLAMVLGQRTAFHNPAKRQARYAVALTTMSGHSRRQG